MEKPEISYIEESNNVSFNSQLVGGTPLWMLDPSQLSTAGATVRVGVAIRVRIEMDAASVMNPARWILRVPTTARAVTTRKHHAGGIE